MVRKINVYYTYDCSSSLNPYLIWMSNHLLTYFGIHPNEKVWFRYGSERIQVTCKVKMDDTFSILAIPEEIQSGHLLPEPDRHYWLFYHPTLNEIQIGPILAIFTEKTCDMTKPFGNITEFAKEIASLCHGHLTSFYLFSLEDIAENHIRGYTFTDGMFTQKHFPFPDVIHNRISSRKTERSEPCIRFFEHCQDFGIPYFNDHFISKWDVFDILVERDALAAYLPETLTEFNEEILLNMLNKYTTLFLKPNHGSEGRGIVRITKTSDGKFKLETSSAIDPPLPLLSNEGIVNFINQFVPKEDYIIQQGITLLNHSGCNVDFRILCNRDEKGDWYITSSIARTSSTNPVVTNMAHGAQTCPLSEMLLSHYEEPTATELKALLFELTLEASASINHSTGGIFGEFGIDFGLDARGHPWILEVNTKPSKHYKTTHRHNDIRPSARGIFRFANYLFSNALPIERRKEFDHA